jgi:hypothetical protein
LPYYGKALSVYPRWAIEAAVEAWITTGHYFPQPADLVDKLRDQYEELKIRRQRLKAALVSCRLKQERPDLKVVPGGKPDEPVPLAEIAAELRLAQAAGAMPGRRDEDLIDRPLTTLAEAEAMIKASGFRMLDEDDPRVQAILRQDAEDRARAAAETAGGDDDEPDRTRT